MSSTTAGTRRSIEHLRERIANSREPSDDDREILLGFSERIDILGKSEYSDHRHLKLLSHLNQTALDAGGLADTLTDREATENIVAWIHRTHDDHETNRDFRVALRVFGRRLAEADDSVDPTTLQDGIPRSIAWVPVTTPKNYKPKSDPAKMLDWDDDVLPMIETGAGNSRDRASESVIVR